jgi:Leucine-rich repeat (LRR) protein
LEGRVFFGAKNLKNLYLQYNSIKHIDHQAFHGLENLESIRLNGNELRHLAKGTFKHNLKLKNIFMQNNLIFMLHRKIFSHLKLTILDLDGNVCIDYQFRYPDSRFIEKKLSHCENNLLLHERKEKEIGSLGDRIDNLSGIVKKILGRVSQL